MLSKIKFTPFFRILLGLLLMGSYIAPTTFVSKLSPLTHITALKAGQISHLNMIILFIIISSVWLIGCFIFKKFISLWCLFGIYMIACLLTAVVWWKDINEAQTCVFVVLAIASGLLAAFICGDVKNASSMFVILATIEACYALYYQHSAFGGQKLDGSDNLILGTYNSPYGVYTVMMLAIPFAFTRALTTVGLTRSVWMLFSGAMFAALCLTWYFWAVIGLCVATAWIIFRLTHKKIPAILVSGLIYTFCVFISLIGPSHRLLSPLESVDRQSISWKQGITVFEDHWLTGVGFGVLSVPMKIDGNKMPPADVTVIPDNQLLYWVDEMGIGGFVLVCLSARIVLRTIYHHQTIDSTSVGASWLAFATAGLVDTIVGPQYSYYGNAIFGFLIALTVMLQANVNSERALVAYQ